MKFRNSTCVMRIISFKIKPSFILHYTGKKRHGFRFGTTEASFDDNLIFLKYLKMSSNEYWVNDKAK